MTVGINFLRKLLVAPSNGAWQTIQRTVVEECSAALDERQYLEELRRREQVVGEVDDIIASSAWELWNSFNKDIESNASYLKKWWRDTSGSKAVLILDGLSIREVPWILEGAKSHDIEVSKVNSYGAELPSETTAFARALGFSSRSILSNNGGRKNFRFRNVRTECSNRSWRECEEYVDSDSNWIFWHHWPDSVLHEEAGAGQGLTTFSKFVKQEMYGDEFWNFVRKLVKDGTLLITSDHGYAVTTFFSRIDKKEERAIKQMMGGKRYQEVKERIEKTLPSFLKLVENLNKRYYVTVGRKKWSSPGGFPVLAHGGISLFEMFCPSIELVNNR